VIDTGFDYTSPDLVMPHPFYAPMHWVCIVNPGDRVADEVTVQVQQHVVGGKQP
jgi:hypothetical protein